ncbi:MAG: hypothetical protein ABSG17_23225, partial [Spirochaetia bacterium]
MVTNHRMLKFGVAIALCFLLAATAFATGGAEKGPVTLRALVFNGWARVTALDLQIPVYEKMTGVKIEYEKVPFEQLHQK